MHAISYQLKRGHLSAVAMGRRLFRGTKSPEDPDFDGIPHMTPARFDILFVVHGGLRQPRWQVPTSGATQTEIRKALGLAAATVCKAVKRLVELGFVEVARDGSGDRRTRLVHFTDEGLQRFRRALHLVFTGRMLRRHYRAFATKHVGVRRNKKGLVARINEALDRIWWVAMCLAQHLGDASEAIYDLRWEPDH